jgi:hypothetical protein
VGHGLEVRAFRGSRRSSTYRVHAVAASRAARLTSLAPTLRPGAELDKRGARGLAEELATLRKGALALELDDDLTALAEVANWCARARGRAWLQVRSIPGRDAGV